MINEEFDHNIKNLFQDFQPDYNPESWDQLSEKLDLEEKLFAENTEFDSSIREAVGDLSPMDIIPAWTDMERKLDLMDAAAQHKFDHNVKEKVDHYEAPYEKESWPVLEEKIIIDARIRRRLYFAKALELVAVILTITTVYTYFPIIKSSIITPTETFVKEKLIHRPDHSEPTADAGNFNQLESPKDNIQDEAISEEDVAQDEREENIKVDAQFSLIQNQADASLISAPGEIFQASEPDISLMEKQDQNSNLEIKRVVQTISQTTKGKYQSTVNTLPTPDLRDLSAIDANSSSKRFAGAPEKGLSITGLAGADQSDKQNAHALASTSLDVLPSSQPGLNSSKTYHITIPAPKQKRKTLVQFGVGASLDVNALYIPADNFYSQGKPLNFTEKDIFAFGNSFGALLTFERLKWGIETGLVYSSKQYEPKRILQIGETFDVHTLDFKNINLNIVSVPLSLRYHLINRSRWKVYTVTGMNFSVIAEAHYDISRKSDPLALLAPPSPEFIANTKEVERVREHILDGAEFRTKSYFSVNAGFGIERRLNQKLNFYMQPSYSYQLPFDKIGNNNNKHIRTLSVTFGTRVPISK